MPYDVKKLPNKKLYRVRNSITGDIKANATTKQNAYRQVRLLNSLEKNPQKWIR